MAEEKAKDSDRVMDNCPRIAREASELEYIWNIEGVGKTEIVDDGDIVE